MRGILISICLVLISLLHQIFADQLKKVDFKYTGVFVAGGIALAAITIIRYYSDLAISEVILIISSVLMMISRTLFVHYKRKNL